MRRASCRSVGRGNVSRHLNRLALAGLVARRREGTTVYYWIGDPTLAALGDLVGAGVVERARALTGA